MTVISEGIFNQQEFFENTNKNISEEIVWEGVNLNTSKISELLLNLKTNLGEI